MSDDTTALLEGQTTSYPGEASSEMIEAGVFYGRKRSKTHPKMKQYVLMNRGGIEIIDLTKTAEATDRATAFLKGKVQSGGVVLLVGTQPAAETEIIRVAERFHLPHVINRWAGGTMTNFKIIVKRVEYFKKLRSDFASGSLEKYTKKERLGLEKEMRRLKELFGGLENLAKEPDVLVVVDPNLHHTALREANRAKIPVIALANVDADPDVVDFLVPGNDKARKSISWFLGKIEAAIAEGLASKAQPAEIETPSTDSK